MKTIFILIAAICSATPLFAQKTSARASDFKKLSWLEGGWNRTDTKPNQSAGEFWTKNGSTEYRGKGISLSGIDTVFVEKIRIIVKGDNLYYAADVPENNGEVLFLLTSVDATGFVCENPEHDFPKKIEYRLHDKKLKATISGDGKAIDYWFERKQ